MEMVGIHSEPTKYSSVLSLKTYSQFTYVRYCNLHYNKTNQHWMSHDWHCQNLRQFTLKILTTINALKQIYSTNNRKFRSPIRAFVRSQLTIDFGRQFTLYSAGNFDTLRRGADIAILLTVDGDQSGVSFFDQILTGQTLAVVMKDTAVGYYRYSQF